MIGRPARRERRHLRGYVKGMLRRLIGRLPPRWRSPYAPLVVPLALILVIGVAAVEVPEPLHLGPLLIVAPALTATFAGPGRTGAVAALSIAVQLLLRLVRHDLTAGQNVIQVGALVLASAFVVGYAAVRERGLRELSQVRSVSEAAQRVLLRPLPDRLGPLRIASLYLAAAPQARIGGDLYAVARIGSCTRLLIGDVRGKGLTSIGDAAVLLCAFREAAHLHAALPELVARLEASVQRNLAELAETDEDASELFITAAVIDVPDDRPVLELIDCGHPPPLLWDGRRVRTLQSGRPAAPLGLGDLAGPGYVLETFPFRPGDTLVLYTDGVVEARDAAGDFYPLAERLRCPPGECPGALVRRLRADLLAHAGGPLGDDAALIVLRRE